MRKTISLTNLFVLLILSSLFMGCEEDNYAKEDDQIIRDYLEEHNISATKHSSGIYYVIHEEGTGKAPIDHTTIIANYVGTFIDGTVFDQRVEPDRIEGRMDQFIKGWQIGLKLIKPGGHISLYIPSRYCYGSNGSSAIPANSILFYDVTLIAFKQ